MNLCIHPSAPTGTIKAIASKSAAHRLLICAAFADGESLIRCEEINDDISATVRCLSALGAEITRESPYFHVTPVSVLRKGALLDCGESGSTLRFLLPIVCMLGADATFQMAGRLPERPLSPLREALECAGCSFSAVGSNPLVCRGQLQHTDFTLPGNISSQFISGLLFALAISGRTGKISIEGKLESAPYVEMTTDALLQFGVITHWEKDGISILESPSLHSPRKISVEGDWSGAAFPLCLGAIGSEQITVTNLSRNSRQGDRAIVTLLRQFGALVSETEAEVTIAPAPLHGIDIDASQIPDLVPILATVASVASGRTVIRNASRLRIKESDRLQTTHALLSSLGASIRETEDGLVIDGVSSLQGGCVSSFGDHRIAMSAAIASVVCRESVTVEDAHVVAKSYPDFWRDMRSLGMDFDEL